MFKKKQQNTRELMDQKGSLEEIVCRPTEYLVMVAD